MKLLAYQISTYHTSLYIYSKDELEDYLDYICDVVISKREARQDRERFLTRPTPHSKLDSIEEEISEEISASISSQIHYQPPLKSQLKLFNSEYFRQQNLKQGRNEAMIGRCTQKSWLSGVNDHLVMEEQSMMNKSIEQTKTQSFLIKQSEMTQYTPLAQNKPDHSSLHYHLKPWHIFYNDRFPPHPLRRASDSTQYSATTTDDDVDLVLNDSSSETLNTALDALA